MRSLKGVAPPYTSQQRDKGRGEIEHFIKHTQSLHCIRVLCPDADLTSDNFCDFMRCDCKGNQKIRACKCTYALAHW